MACWPRSTCVPGWPSAPAVLTVFTKVGSKPTLGLPVVTSGIGNGGLLSHQSTYSALTQPRQAGATSTPAVEGIVPAGGALAALPSGAALVSGAALASGEAAGGL